MTVEQSKRRCFFNVNFYRKKQKQKINLCGVDQIVLAFDIIYQYDKRHKL